MSALFASLAAAVDGSAAPARAARLPVKVLVIDLFSLEATPWIAALKPTQDIAVPGLPSNYPSVKCNADAVCQMTTGMGHANAAASVMVVLVNAMFDLREAYFLIADIDPAHGTLGSATWARYIVDAGIAHEIDARAAPRLVRWLFRRRDQWTERSTEVRVSHRGVSARRGAAATGARLVSRGEARRCRRSARLPAPLS
jgi:purine nucleoside permease